MPLRLIHGYYSGRPRQSETGSGFPGPAWPDLPGHSPVGTPAWKETSASAWMRSAIRFTNIPRPPFSWRCRDELPVGRLAVLDNRRYNDYNHAKDAFFYLFECDPDPQAANGLFDAAFAWARRRGLDQDARSERVYGAGRPGIAGQRFRAASRPGAAIQSSLLCRVDRRSGLRKDE